MSVLITAIPLFDGTMTVKAYRLRDQNANMALDIKDDFRSRSQVYFLPGLELLQQIGLEPFANEKPLFLDVNRFHVLSGMFGNKSVPPEKLVLTVTMDAVAPVDEELLNSLAELKEKGYGIALDGYPAGGLENPIAAYVEHIILNFEDKNLYTQISDVKKTMKHMRIILSNLPDMETYNKYAASRNTLFTGNFYNHPVTRDTDEISPLKINALRLLKQINEEDFELKNIAQTIERDPSLSISLLRFINSAAVGLRSEVNSIQSAVALLGQKEVRHWATIAISVDISQDRPSEITKLSLVRGKFAENLAPLFEMAVHQNSLFMTGLFSMLDAILEKPMEQAVQEVAVDSMVREALVDRSGDLFKVLDFMYAYERADWHKVSVILIRNGIKGEAAGQAFVDALVWYHQLLDSIDEESESGGGEEGEDAEKIDA